MEIHQIHASGQNNYITVLENKFLDKKREIQLSKEFSQKEKKEKIALLEKGFKRKKKILDYFNF